MNNIFQNAKFLKNSGCDLLKNLDQTSSPVAIKWAKWRRDCCFHSKDYIIKLSTIKDSRNECYVVRDAWHAMCHIDYICNTKQHKMVFNNTHGGECESYLTESIQKTSQMIPLLSECKGGYQLQYNNGWWCYVN